MTRLLTALGYALLFAAFGAGAATCMMFTLPRHPAPHLVIVLSSYCFVAALSLWALALSFGLLPGARHVPQAPARMGLGLGIWAMAGFALTMAASGLFLTCTLAALLTLRHPDIKPALSSPDFLISVVLAGEFTVALWLARNLGRLPPAVRHDSGAAGLAWCPAAPRAYAEAAAMALAVLGVVALLYKIFPPDMSAIQDLPIAQLFAGPPVVMAAMLVVAVLFGPVLEELAFRGLGFAGVAAGLGPVWATALTSLAFMAAHATEKMHYLPGFIDVGLLAVGACVLRLRHGSLRPGMLLHILYNGGGLVVAALLH